MKTAIRFRFTPKALDDLTPGGRAYRAWDAVVPQLFVRVQTSAVKSFNVQWTESSSKSSRQVAGHHDPGRSHPGAVPRSPNATARRAHRRHRGAQARQRKPITLGEFIRDHYAPWATANQKQPPGDARRIEGAVQRPERQAARRRLRIRRRTVQGRTPQGGHSSLQPMNRDVDRIRSVLSTRVEWDRLTAHPLKTVKRIKGVDDTRVRYLTPDEERRLREALATREAKRRKARVSGVSWRAVRGRRGATVGFPESDTGLPDAARAHSR